MTFERMNLLRIIMRKARRLRWNLNDLEKKGFEKQLFKITNGAQKSLPASLLPI